MATQKHWVTLEEEILRNFPNVHAQIVGDLLERSVHSVRTKRNKLGVVQGNVEKTELERIEFMCESLMELLWVKIRQIVKRIEKNKT